MEKQFITKFVVPKVLAAAYPANTQLLQHDIGTKKGGNAGDGGFASNTFQMQLKVKSQDKESTDYTIVKIFPQDPAMRALHNSGLQFHNEALWYTEVVPAYKTLASQFGLDVNHLWPKFYAVVENDLTAIVMQDLSNEGFKLAQPASKLDLDHAQLAMTKIAALHSLSYALANCTPEKHQHIVDSLKDCRFGPEVNMDGFQPDFLKNTSERGLAPLRARPECAEIVAAFDKLLKDAVEMHRQVLCPHDDKTDVLCHGDFLRNNLLYKYDCNQKVVDARLIDFATVRLASPCSDLALFIFLSVDPDVFKGDGLKVLLKKYYSSLTSMLNDMGKVQDPWRGSFEDLEKEFARCVPFAFTICAFFLPLMMAPSEDFQMEDMMSMTPEEQEEQNRNLGGPEATQRLVDLILDFQKRGFHKFW